MDACIVKAKGVENFDILHGSMWFGRFDFIEMELKILNIPN